jgi:hypothetical protein
MWILQSVAKGCVKLISIVISYNYPDHGGIDPLLYLPPLS